MKEIEELLAKLDDGDNQDIHEAILKALAEKDKRIAELEAKIKKMEYWWEELSGRRRINKSRACGVSHEILAKQSITKHRNLKSNS
jgi:DNA-binding transcriptional MerR regulator